MEFATACVSSAGGNHFRPHPSPIPRPITITAARTPPCFLLLYLTRPRRLLGTSAESAVPPPDFDGGENAYEVLDVSETCSYDEIKVSFRKLAKETHPDLTEWQNGGNSDDASKRFVQILAAYEILSDPCRRAHYDQYLLTQRHIVQKHLRRDSDYHMYATHMGSNKQVEVVEWLKWYRYAVKDILSENRMVGGTGYFDVLQQNLYSAIRAAYYGPEIEAIDLLPDRFEAEERSVCDTAEVLHLVSGRDLFGVVYITEKIPQLSEVCYKTLSSSGSTDLGSYRLAHNDKMQDDIAGRSGAQMTGLDAYKNLELHVFGRLVATATRTPPKCSSNAIEDEDSLDQIHVFLTSDENPMRRECNSSSNSPDRAASEIQLGKITGLGNSSEESSCYFYNSFGTKTHVILKHRTLLVKHMHWFQLGDEVSICECRCTRARLPPSKFWLFEPRCSTHDIGGWYVETFGRDRRSQNVPSQRYWDGIAAGQNFEKRLHPAVYLLALAYRTLDMEIARRRKHTIRDIVQGSLFKIFERGKKSGSAGSHSKGQVPRISKERAGGRGDKEELDCLRRIQNERPARKERSRGRHSIPCKVSDIPILSAGHGEKAQQANPQHFSQCAVGPSSRQCFWYNIKIVV